MMAIRTAPPNKAYDEGYERTFGRKCSACRATIDEASTEEWEARLHKGCVEVSTAATVEEAPGM